MGTFSFADWQRWNCRNLDLLTPTEQQSFHNNGTMVCALKRVMVAHNKRKVLELQEPVAVIKAKTTPPSEASRSSADSESSLPGSIMLCRGTKFRLTQHIWTKAGLTNGAKGVVDRIIYKEGSKPPELPLAVIGIFDQYSGERWRDDMDPKAVPICPVQSTWISHKKSCTREMRQIILGYILSVHKMQGDTVEKVILNAGETEFALRLLLV
jgi:hypothetical protein